MQSAQISFLPKSRLGRWSVWLMVVCLGLFLVADLTVGSLGPESHRALAIALTAVIGAVAAGALATGTMSVARNGERSIIVFVVMALGLYQLFSVVVALLGLPK
jgi:hypothetical protein